MNQDKLETINKEHFIAVFGVSRLKWSGMNWNGLIIIQVNALTTNADEDEIKSFMLIITCDWNAKNRGESRIKCYWKIWLGVRNKVGE